MILQGGGQLTTDRPAGKHQRGRWPHTKHQMLNIKTTVKKNTTQGLILLSLRVCEGSCLFLPRTSTVPELCQHQ